MFEKETSEQKKRRQENGFYLRSELGIFNQHEKDARGKKTKKSPWQYQSQYEIPEVETDEQIKARQQKGFYRRDEIMPPKKSCNLF